MTLIVAKKIDRYIKVGGKKEKIDPAICVACSSDKITHPIYVSEFVTLWSLYPERSSFALEHFCGKKEPYCKTIDNFFFDECFYLTKECPVKPKHRFVGFAVIRNKLYLLDNERCCYQADLAILATTEKEENIAYGALTAGADPIDCVNIVTSKHRLQMPIVLTATYNEEAHSVNMRVDYERC